MTNEKETAEKFAGHAASMTLRDHFAGLAMQVFIKHVPYPTQNEAKAAYALADAMMEERKK